MEETKIGVPPVKEISEQETIAKVIDLILQGEAQFNAYEETAASHRDELGIYRTGGSEVDLKNLAVVREKYPEEFDRNYQGKLRTQERQREGVRNRLVTTEDTGNELTLTFSGNGANFLGQAFPCIADSLGIQLVEGSQREKKPFTGYSTRGEQETETWSGDFSSGQTIETTVLHLSRLNPGNTESYRYVKKVTIKPKED